jgi:competence protein ComEA
MSSIASTPLDQASAPAAHAERLCPWPVSVRVLLIVVTMIGAVGLRTASLRLGRESRGPFRAAPVLVVDPNSAPPAVLGALPHVGGALVKKIVEQREIRPFQSLGDLRHRVRGLGPATLARLAPHLRIGPSGQPDPSQEDDHPLIAAIPSPTTLAQGSGASDVR